MCVFKVISVSCVLLIFYSVSVFSSGFYYDNGLDQTIIDHQMSKQDKYEVEHEILNLLGLPTRPKRKSIGPLRKAAPKFLLDVYKSLMEEENGRYKRTADSKLNLTGEEQHAIDESDIIMTFENQNQKVSNVRHERGKRLWFNVSEIPIEDNIIGAELRIYKYANTTNVKLNTTYVVTIYQLVNTDGERELEYVQSLNTTGDFESWLEFNLTSALSTWVTFPESYKGLYLSVHAADKPAREIRPEDIGLVSTKGNDEKQPFMVAFMKTRSQVRIQSTSTRMKREARMKKSEYNPSHTFKNIYNNPASHGSSRSCNIQTLYIHFKDLKWQDWIIAPEGYAAYYCSGECKFPLNAHMNATNHAIVQTLVHLMTPTQVPKPCCAPTRLTPISVLYFSDDSNVVLKKYKKMSVKSCGCH